MVAKSDKEKLIHFMAEIMHAEVPVLSFAQCLQVAVKQYDGIEMAANKAARQMGGD